MHPGVLVADTQLVLGVLSLVTLTTADTAYGVAFPQNARSYIIRSRGTAAKQSPGSALADAAAATYASTAGEILVADAQSTYPVPGVGDQSRNLDSATRRIALFTSGTGIVVEIRALP